MPFLNGCALSLLSIKFYTMKSLIQNPSKINLINGLVLVIAGLFGFIARYLDQNDLQYTALIPSIFGIILLAMNSGLKNHNKIIAHIVVVVTLLVVIMVGSMLNKSLAADPVNVRRVAIFSVIVMSGLVSTVLYVLGFIEKRKEKNAK